MTGPFVIMLYKMITTDIIYKFGSIYIIFLVGFVGGIKESVAFKFPSSDFTRIMNIRNICEKKLNSSLEKASGFLIVVKYYFHPIHESN